MKVFIVSTSKFDTRVFLTQEEANNRIEVVLMDEPFAFSTLLNGISNIQDIYYEKKWWVLKDIDKTLTFEEYLEEGFLRYSISTNKKN